MSRVQLALNVSNLDEAITFYSKLFATDPAKREPGYANFAVAEPPLKLVLIEDPAASGRLNHLGVEVGSSGEVDQAQARLAGKGVATTVENGVDCCYARQDKVWVHDPDGAPWEVYTVLTDTEMPHQCAGSDKAPVACTLGAGEVEDRLDEWQGVLASVRNRVPLDGGMRLELDPAFPIAEAARLAAAEQGCCRFFSFALTVDPRGPALEVRAPAEAADMLEQLFDPVPAGDLS